MNNEKNTFQMGNEEESNGGLKKFAKILYKIRFFWLVLITSLTIFFDLSIKIETDNSLKVWFSENGLDYIFYEDFRDEFGEGKFLIVVILTKNLFYLLITKKSFELTYPQTILINQYY